jgi:hypothetical protein
VPGLPWPHPCGIDTTPGLIASVTSTVTRPQYARAAAPEGGL